MTSVPPVDPVAWWDQNGDKVEERISHVDQKLGHLGQVSTGLKALQSQLGHLRQWLEGMRSTGGSLRDPRVMLDPTFFVRIASAGLTLRHALANLGLLAGTAPTGTAAGASGPSTGGAGSSSADVQAAERAAFDQQAGNILDAGSPWAGGGLATVVDEFGVTGNIDKGLGRFLLGELWDGFTSPFETYQEHKFSHLALDAMQTFQQEHGDELLEMTKAFQDALNAIERLESALKGARLDSPSSTLGGGAASELRDALDTYESIESEAGPPPGAGGGSPFEGPAVPEGAGFDAEFDPSTDLAEPTPPEMSDEAFKQYVREQIGDPTWEPPPPSASPFADDLP